MLSCPTYYAGRQYIWASGVGVCVCDPLSGGVWGGGPQPHFGVVGALLGVGVAMWSVRGGGGRPKRDLGMWVRLGWGWS